MNRRTITLVEHGTRRLQLSADEASDLARLAQGRLQLAATPVQGMYDLTAGSHVGTLVVGDVAVLVRPKVALENVLLLLGAGLDDIRWWRERFGYGAYDDLVPAFASFFARTVETAIRRGLLRAYRQEEGRLRTLRGRIDFAEQLRRPGIDAPIACTWDDFTADVDLNRYLKAAVRQAVRLPGIGKGTRRLLMRELTKFEEVADTSPRIDLLDAHMFTRLDRHYQPAWALARLLLGREAITDRSGTTASQSFMIDMNRLFEKFLERRLRSALAGDLEVRGQDPHHLDHDRMVPMRPDLVFTVDRAPVYVADAKYKRSETGLARHGDYYQLLAYTTAIDLPEGLLVYCHVEGDEPAREVTVRHTGKRLVTYRLSLSGRAENIETQVRELAEFISSRASGRAGSPRRIPLSA